LVFLLACSKFKNDFGPEQQIVHKQIRCFRQCSLSFSNKEISLFFFFFLMQVLGKLTHQNTNGDGGYADIDLIQFRVVCLLQDRHTPACRIDDIVTGMVQDLLDGFFGEKNIGPRMLQRLPPGTELSHTQQFLKGLVDDSAFVSHDLRGPLLDAAWKDIQKRAAHAMAAWSKRFPHREFLNALKLFDAITAFGASMPPRGRSSIESCYAAIEKFSGFSPAMVQRSHDIFKPWATAASSRMFGKAPADLTVEECEQLQLAFLAAHDLTLGELKVADLCITRNLVMQKSSADLERDFKHMRDLMNHGGQAMSDDSIDFRLRVVLNTPRVLNSGAEADGFLERICTEMRRDKTASDAIGLGKRRGRPVGALGKSSTKRKVPLSAVTAKRMRSNEFEEADHLRTDLHLAGYDDGRIDPLKFVSELVGKRPSASVPSTMLLDEAKLAATERAVQVAEAKKTYDESKPAKKVAAETSLVYLPAVALSRSSMTVREAVRYGTLLFNCPSASIKMNHKTFCVDYFDRHLHGKLKMSDVDFHALLLKINRMKTEDERILFVLEGRRALS
jgi:hypothetical protein